MNSDIDSRIIYLICFILYIFANCVLYLPLGTFRFEIYIYCYLSGLIIALLQLIRDFKRKRYKS